MAIIMNITTSNEGSDGGGFHELHKIKYLSSPAHAIATVERIIGLNLTHACVDSKLYDVEIETGNSDVIEALNKWKEFFDTLKNGVSIRISFHPMLI